MVFARGFAVWVIIILGETVHGIIRGLYLSPVAGDFLSRQIGVFSGSVIIFIISLFFIRWIHPAGYRDCIFTGAMWLVLTMAFEIVLGMCVFGYPSERIMSDFNIFEGGLLGFGMAFLLLAPLLAWKIRKTDE
ncbi:MAG TPA: hypothetical protein PK544_18605 [Spirochaetota bacterium]|nr:hypothetical protein [Spirochaetota bacterium]HPJ39869.1 hypothetical protein [Spirochaetota bacterium]HPQ54495.1 hypothetical protein [Spirochaetota bacterium]